MASGIFNVAISGLNAAQTGVLTTSHNIANASTPGYSRQQIIQTTNTPQFTGAGFIGKGTNVESIQRVYSQYLTGQVLSAQTGAAQMDSYLAQIRQIDNLLADPSAGLSPALADFFKGVQEVAANPASLPARQAMLSSSQSLVARFQSIDQRLREIREGVNSQITSEITLINSYSKQIADVNQRIVLAQASGPGQPANDLLDQRDQLIADLNKEIRVSTLQQTDGTFSVFIGNGQPLVVGNLSYTMQAVAASDDPERTIVALRSPTGTTVNIPESMLTGGKLGGLIAFRAESLDSVQNSLGRIALTLAQNFNDQHRLGQDLTGALGSNYFDTSMAGPVVMANSNNAVPPQSPVVTVSNYAALTTSDYRLSYDGANYTVTRLSDSLTQTFATLPQTVDGVTIATGSWTPVAGDSFQIQPTRNGAGNLALSINDTRNIAAAAPIRSSAALTNSGTGRVDPGTVVDTTNVAFATPGMLTPPIVIQFDTATSYTIYDNTNPLVPVALEGPIPYTAGTEVFPTPLSLDYGYRIKISGAPAGGDKFAVDWNSNGVSDNRNTMLLGALQTQTPMANGTASYQSAYSQIVSQVGNKTREVEVTGKAQQTLADQAQNEVEKMSGVNLDEEAANLLRFQQAYQASAKLIEIAGRLFDEILAISR
ncbi:MAG: flagellar hook-associated protein FlgK [Gammaproteobacteria bacterium]|nr:flagellar hook-associated protein FlgK [Rhodocyclaceae bacterium]MBU3909529.1 flagellar hook-associated protein FlgK [Gammaproteobacteria bacterium]MBU3990088.1 flagellar hook-associated protein FlgK [Gammaproteobacteria bacterium]MBU4003192.1 flagellar hook-associated protein FlgK [Gammaproteobacteria bacterium]MBU4022241.1 flagellar hook-associated protein FlgK [Gammaproteobacteria bacterium]